MSRMQLVITLDPDGVPVALQDIAGDTLDGTLWGAARADGAVALIVTEDNQADFFDRTPNVPTVGQLRALADALDDDPNDPELTPGCRQWEKKRADDAVHALSVQVDRTLGYIEEIAQLRRDLHAAHKRVRRETEHGEQLRGDLLHAQQQIREQTRELDAARTAGRDTARRAVLALTRRTRRLR